MSKLSKSEAAGAGVGLFGSILGAGATADQAGYDRDAQYQQADFNEYSAEQNDARALEEEAAASREAAERYRQIKINASRALAVGAATGSRTDEGDILQGLAEFEQYALYEAQNSLYEGGSRARQFREQAGVLRVDAINRRKQGDIIAKTGAKVAKNSVIAGIADTGLKLASGGL